MKCYVHAVSPVKNSKSSSRRYFNFVLQEKDNTVRGVCFSPNKHSELHTLQQTKSPVKVSNYVKSQNSDDIIFNQSTKVTPLDSTNIDFLYSDKLTTTGMLKNISCCNDLASEQLVTLKAEVAQISGVKKIQTQHQGTLTKQEVILRDPTDFIKAVLWDSNVDTLTEEKTYIFKNFKIKVYKGDKYLNTPKNETFEANETTQFDHPLVEIDVNLGVTSTTITGKVIGVQEVVKTLCCVNCKKNVIPVPGDDLLGQCNGCNSMQVVDACEKKCSFRLLLQSTENPLEKRRLVFYNQEVQQLKDILGLSLDINTSSERNVMVAILQAAKEIKVTFDSMTSKVIDIVAV